MVYPYKDSLSRFFHASIVMISMLDQASSLSTQDGSLRVDAEITASRVS